MGDYLTKGSTYVDGGTVNAANLNAHVDDAVIKPTAISARASVGVPGGAVEFLVNDAGTLKKVTVTDLASAVGPAGSLINGKAAITTLEAADAFLVYDSSAAADKKITQANLFGQLAPSGTVLQTLQSTVTTNTSLSASIPIDDTVPLITEGNAIDSTGITPASTSNKVLVRFKCNAAASSTGETIVAALFRGSTCIDAMSIQVPNGTSATTTFILEDLDSPASASAVTYSVRMGVSAGTYRLNGYTAGRLFGGASQATLTVQEIKG